MRLANFQIFCAICRHRQVLIFVANCLPTRNSLRKFRKKNLSKAYRCEGAKASPWNVCSADSRGETRWNLFSV